MPASWWPRKLAVVVKSDDGLGTEHRVVVTRYAWWQESSTSPWTPFHFPAAIGTFGLLAFLYVFGITYGLKWFPGPWSGGTVTAEGNYALIVTGVPTASLLAIALRIWLRQRRPLHR